MTSPNTSSKGISLLPNSVADAVDAFYAKYRANPQHHSRLYIAFSGGLDSSVLLTALQKSLIRNQWNIELVALHVNHQLQDQAVTWQSHCQQVCQELGIVFLSRTLNLQGFQRQGLESVARKARYQALLEMLVEYESQFETQYDVQDAAGYADEVDAKDVFSETSSSDKIPVDLLFAHHQRDQAETLLLNLFRGAGVNGLSAIPENRSLLTDINQELKQKYPSVMARFEISLQRPLLNLAYAELLDYAKQFQLSFIEDPSNSDDQFQRNWIRNRLLPELEERWPAIQKQLSTTARHMSEAGDLLDKMALKNLENHCFNSDFIALKTDMDWLQQKNMIRFWLKLYWPKVVLSDKHYHWLQQCLLTPQLVKASMQLSRVELHYYQQRFYVVPKAYLQLSKQVLSNRYRLIGFEQFKSALINNDDLANDPQLSEMAFNPEFYFDINDLDQKSKVEFRPLVWWKNLEETHSKTSDDNGVLRKKALKQFFQTKQIPVWLRDAWPVMVDEKGVLLAVLGCSNCIRAQRQTLSSNDFKRGGQNNGVNVSHEIFRVSYSQVLGLIGDLVCLD